MHTLLSTYRMFFRLLAVLTVGVTIVCHAQPTTTTKAVTYYVNSETGNDAQSGTSPAKAWQSLDRVNAQIFQPGEKILFRAGTHYSGQLKPQGSGSLLAPIVIGKYGHGPLPRIDGEGHVLDTALLRNVEFWDVNDLEITNLGEKREPWGTGVRVVTDAFGVMQHIHLHNLFVHDVNGSLSKSNEGCGIYFESRGRGSDSHFDDLLVDVCHLLRTDRNGICQRNGSGIHSQRVVIRGNLLEDIGGDGIKLWGSDAPLVEHNVLHGGRMRCDDYAAGIWPFDCNDALIQFNEVSGMKGTKDGQGFDSDYRCRHSVFQYNYSHDNEGGFMLVCSPGNSFNEDTVIRYNISQNDGINSARVFNISGVKNTLIYNNTIYVGPKQDLPLLLFSTWNRGNADGTKFFNNIFYVDGRVTYKWGQSINTVFSNNVFCGNHSEIPGDSYAITNRAPLRQPGNGGTGRDSLAGYRPQTAKTFPRGQIVPDNGGQDFFGQPIPPNRPPLLGAVSAKD